ARLPLALARADAVLAAGEAQVAWWRQALHGAGRPEVPVLDVPFGIPDEDPPPESWSPPGLPEGWAIVLWWGGVWPWLDLDTLLAARARLGEAPLSLVVPVTARPGGFARAMDRETLLRMAGRHGLEPPQVLPLETWLPYAQRHRLLNRATLLAVLHHPGEEARLSFRTRALDAVWAGVPLLLSEGGAVAELSREHGWGAVAPVHDPKAVAAAMELMASEREQLRCRKAIAKSRGDWRWPRVAEPLIRILPQLPVAPRRRLALPALRAALELAGLRTRSW
ncbi:MAG: glycosyltransferase family 4 protein, partial [Acidobacteria bacterium]|nr:glycosyltransferase family 4 protein [Acidobacteriota bacterium]